ncbi:MAG: HD domain-containing protein [Candidatus Gracilibacteria bacterium]|nr:HD domain-containing protein [Candidatus Gracilibacteria bacterium]
MNEIIWVRKSRQEKILEDLILSSKMVDEDILFEVKKYYQNNSFHNYLHALKTASYVLYLNPDKFNLMEIKSLLLAALYHDARHKGKVHKLDEFISLDIALESIDKLTKENKIFGIDGSIIRGAIIGTVFISRGKNSNRYGIILGDFDIGVLGEDIVNFLYYSFPLAFEFGQSIETFLTETQRGYFKYLMSINRDIIISSEARGVLPNSYQVITEFCRIPLEKKLEMFDYLKNKDITLEEFREFFSKTILS